jgi:hypothetical protein
MAFRCDIPVGCSEFRTSPPLRFPPRLAPAFPRLATADPEPTAKSGMSALSTRFATCRRSTTLGDSFAPSQRRTPTIRCTAGPNSHRSTDVVFRGKLAALSIKRAGQSVGVIDRGIASAGIDQLARPPVFRGKLVPIQSPPACLASPLSSAAVP